MSVRIEKASLKNVIEQIRAKYPISIKGLGYLEGKNISIEFEDISIEKGIKRILVSMNHSLIYDRKGRIEGIIILETEDSAWTRSPMRSRRPFRRTPSLRRR